MHTKLDRGGAVLARAVNLANCGLVVLDAAQEIVLWSAWMVPRAGYAAARVQGRPLTDVFPELRGSRVEAAVLAALTQQVGATIPASQEPSPFPLREAGSFDGARLDQAVTVTPFAEGGERFCLIEIRDVSGTLDRERRLLDHAESLRARS
ncbi:PAS domain-containing protein [Massilia phyllostachyos]|uniref:PAS domain-containing protein n=1 Tax=Massilia phyllostachyos TaxID=2898585 RepID=UPI0027D9B07F|nr:PAS domain-containing protein [Massilia phyllostachyos]